MLQFASIAMRLLTGLKLLYRGFSKKDEIARFTLAEKLSEFIYPTYKFGDYGRTYLDDHSFIRDYSSMTEKGNYHTLDKKFVLDQLTQLALSVPGDTAECGTYRGSSSFFVCRRIQGTGKHHHVFDSFEGLSAPSAADGTFWVKGALTMPEEVARKTLSPYPFVEFHRGWIPTTFESVKDRTFCFLHVDVDLFQPTLESLGFFYQRLAKGGVIIGDDYGLRTCPGARQAFDDFFKTKPEPIVHLSTGQALIIKQ